MELELKATFAGSVSQGLNFAVVFKAASIENNFGNLVRGSTLCNKLTDLRSSSHVGANACLLAESGFKRVNGNQGLSCQIINDLSCDMTSREMDCQAGTGGCACQLLTKTGVAEFTFVCC